MHRFTAWIEAHKGESIGIAIGLIGLVVVLFLARRGGSGAPGQTPAFVFPGGGGGGSADGGGPGASGSTGSSSGSTSDRTPAPQGGNTTPPGDRTPAPQGGNTTSSGERTPAPQIDTTNVLAPFSGSAGSSSRVGAPQSN